jgi:hypothetical protein
MYSPAASSNPATYTPLLFHRAGTGRISIR